MSKFAIPKISANTTLAVLSNPLTDDDIENGKDILNIKPKTAFSNTIIPERRSSTALGKRRSQGSMAFGEAGRKKDDKILTEIDLDDLKRARENPKLVTMVGHIESLVEKTEKARKDLESIIQISVELKEQTSIQKKENLQIDQDQKRLGDEMQEIKTKVEQLNSEKIVLEQKLELLRKENDELEAFLNRAKDEFQSSS